MIKGLILIFPVALFIQEADGQTGFGELRVNLSNLYKLWNAQIRSIVRKILPEKKGKDLMLEPYMCWYVNNNYS